MSRIGAAVTRHSFTGSLMTVFLLSLVGVLIWISDRITLQGERTVYTVKCEQGEWNGERCTGVLMPGERYAFRASPGPNEVIHWMRGAAASSEKYTDCTVKDRDNWTCNVLADQSPTVTCEMVKGSPTHGCNGLAPPFHDVPKWKWWAMRAGLHVFKNARG